VISLAGIDSETYRRRAEAEISQRLSPYSSKVVIEHDAHVVLLSNADRGVVVIAGTGSIAYGYDGMRTYVTGDRGWLVGDFGSGFWIGRETLRELLAELQGLSEKSLISKLIPFTEEELVRFLYENSCNIGKVASFSKPLLRAVEMGDQKAYRILNDTMRKLADQALSLCKMLREDKLYYHGGMFASKTYTRFFTSYLKEKGINAIPSSDLIKGFVKLASS